MTPAERLLWLRQRQLGIGGSDAAAILGLSPWAGEFEVWLDKTQPILEQDDVDLKHQKRGRLLERAVGNFMADEMERTLTPGGLIVHPDHDWLRGSPDFWLDDLSPGALVPRLGAEAKTARQLDDSWGPAGSDRIPAHYKLQCLVYLACTDVPRWCLGVFETLTEDWRILYVDRDDNADVIDALVNRLGEWWQLRIVRGVAPELDTSRAAAQYLNRRHANHSGRLRWAEPEERYLIKTWQAAKTMEQQANAVRKECEVQIKAAIADDAGLTGDWGRVKWARWQQESLDMARVRKDLPVFIEALESGGYIKRSDRGRLNFTPPKGKK